MIKILYIVLFFKVNILHYNRDNYGSLSEAMEYRKGLAIVAILVEVNIQLIKI